MMLAAGMYFSKSFFSFSLEDKRINDETILKNVHLHVEADSQQKGEAI